MTPAKLRLAEASMGRPDTKAWAVELERKSSAPKSRVPVRVAATSV
jgi:hypothetical protein